MSRIYICVHYQGEWNRSNGVWDWFGPSLECKGIMVERSLKFEEFIEKMYKKTGIDKNEYSIEVRHKCPGDLHGISHPILISDDTELADFFCLYAEEKATAVYVESKAKQKCLVDNENDDGQRQFNNDDHFGLEIVDDRISRMEPVFGCYGEALEVRRVRRSNGIGSNSTPSTSREVLNVEASNPRVEASNLCIDWNEDRNQDWDQELGDLVPVPAIGWNEESYDSDEEEEPNDPGEEEEPNEEFVGDETLRSHPELRSQSSEHANRRHDGSDLHVGQRFETKADMNYKLNLVAIQGKFEMKIHKSTTRMKVVTCVDENCSWRLRAVKPRDSTVFEIRRYNSFHTCTMMSRSIHHKQASSRVIASRMKGHFASTKTPPKPKMLVEFVRNELEVQCSYWKAWKASKFAQDLIRGTPEHSFSILPSYCYMLKMANPGTVTHIEVDEQERFKYFFLALGAQIRGFRFMRKVIGVDGAWMKTRFKGVLLVASTQDSEYHSYPIAWGVVDSENNASWTWFLEKLKELIPDDPELCFISDRGHSIEHAVNLVYPQAKHGACYFHVKMNIKHRFKSCASHGSYFKAAEAYTVQEFNRHFDELRARFPNVAKYLEDDVGFEKWARAKFCGNRYEVMTTNIVETVNHMMNEAREYPITALVDFILETMGQWFLQRRSASLAMDNLQITPAREKIVRERWNIACSLTPMQLNVHEFNVKCGDQQAMVNLGTRRCECKVFDIDGLPCVHAIAAAGKLQPENTDELVYSYCNRYYSVDYFILAYAETIYPVAQESQWCNIPEEIKATIVRVPDVKSVKGRPRLSRFPSRGEVSKKQYRCSKCNNIGHTRKSCRNDV